MNQRATTTKIKRGRGRLIAGGALLIVAGLLWANPVWDRGELSAMKLLPAPERYTELYFPQNLLLPKTAGTNPVAFSFTVHNAEGQTTAYPYVVVMTTPDGKTQQLASGQVVLADGQMKTVPETLTLPQGVTTAEVAVMLPVQQESIHFWLGAQS